MNQIYSAIDKCFSSLITDTDVKNVNDNVVVKFLTVTKLINELTKTEE